jgi:chromate transporter
MAVLSIAYLRTHSLPAVTTIFNGLQAVIVAVMANATVAFGKPSLSNWRDGIIAVAAAGLFGVAANPVFIVALSALLGVLLSNGTAGTRKAAPTGAMKPTTLSLLVLILLFGAGFALLFVFREDLFQLALLMTKVDLLAFGGAFGSVPLMFHEIVEARSWMDAPTFLNGIVLGQFTPGPIVITATFVGYLLHGIFGAFLATLAVFSPSFIILIGVAPWFERLRSNPWFTRAIHGILCSFVGLLFTVTIRFGMNVQWGWPPLIIAAGAFAALFFKVDLLWVILAGAAISALAV